MIIKKTLNIRELTLKNGMMYPDDRELIMLILGAGTKNMPVEYMAKKILAVLVSYNPEFWVEKMCEIEGVGQSKALAVAAALELGRRHNRSPQARVNHPSDVIPFVKHYAMQPTEHFVCISVNGAHEIIAIRVICIGSGNMALLRPNEIFCDALKDRAAGIILCHNHPGGKAEPSNEDILTTEHLNEAAELLGLSLLDHIIVTKTSYFSFLEHKMLPTELL